MKHTALPRSGPVNRVDSMHRLVVWLMAVASLCALGAVLPAMAGGAHNAHNERDKHEERDHDRARRAVQAGQVMSLREVLTRLERSHPGKVLEVELEGEEGRWVYELKVLQDDGRLIKLKVDARSGEVLKARLR
jgi:uncharacterized membrane protein YkoI